MQGVVAVVLVVALVHCCYGDGSSQIQHLVLLDHLPDTVSASASAPIVIRTNYSGNIEFREAEDFKILLNITAPSIEEAYAVSSELIEDKGIVVLQVYEKPLKVSTIGLKWIFLVIGCIGAAVMLVTAFSAIWWYHKNKDVIPFLGSNPDMMYRSRNSMHLGAQAGDLMYGEDNVDMGKDDNGGENIDDAEAETIRLDKIKPGRPETIPEESEGSHDGDEEERERKIYRFPLPKKSAQRSHSFGQRQRGISLSADNAECSGVMKYPDQSGDELDEDFSPEQLIADADGGYTPLDDLLDDSFHNNELVSSQSQGDILGHERINNYNINLQAISEGNLARDQKKKPADKTKAILTLNEDSSPPKFTLNLSTFQPDAPQPKPAQKPVVQPSKKDKKQNVGLRVKIPCSTPKFEENENENVEENDLSRSPQRTTAVQIHKPEEEDRGSGQYISLKPQQYISLKPPPPGKAKMKQNILPATEPMSQYPPMSTFKGQVSQGQGQIVGHGSSPQREKQGRPIPAKKPSHLYVGSPGNFDLEDLKFDTGKLAEEPMSPGNFSMLSDISGASSEIFDGNEEERRHILDDSDVDIGDIDLEEEQTFPSPPPMGTNLPIDTTGAISQLSPRQSFASPADSYGTYIALTGSPSPGGPLSNKDGGQDVREGSRFVFPPPPPMHYSPGQNPAWSRQLFPKEGDYVGIRHFNQPKQGFTQPKQNVPPPRQDKPEDKGKRERKPSGGGKKGGKGLKHLHLTIVSMMCVISLVTGVYSLTTPDSTKVDIVVFAPPDFLKNKVVYLASGKHVDQIHSKEQVQYFETEDPVLRRLNSDLCNNHTCSQGCDDNTGNCVCYKGYTMANGKCIDVNECSSPESYVTHCHGGCINQRGTYECLCADDHYSDGKTCKDCAVKCPEGKFEYQACSGNGKDKKGKICRDCTKTCEKDYYMLQKCSNTSDAVCLTCRWKCSDGEFEFSQCTNEQNRECRAMRELPAPVIPKHVLFENKPAVVKESNHMTYLPDDFRGTRMFTFLRGQTGSDVYLQVLVKYLDPMGIFRSVNHANSMNQGDFLGPRAVVDDYCAYPLPSKYRLSSTLHENVIYKGDPRKGPHGISPCSSHINRFPKLQQSHGSSIFCSEPGHLSFPFDNADPSTYTRPITASTVWVEKSAECAAKHTHCEACAGWCAWEIITGKNQCRINGGSDPDGRSPTLPACFSCCAKNNCASNCTDYHTAGCELERCQEGNLKEIKLEPVYPMADNYFCHVEQMLNQHLIEVEYFIFKASARLHHGNLSIYSNEEWQKTGIIRASDDVINIEIDSKMKVPNIIQGNLGSPNFKVGMYRNDGSSIASTKLHGSISSVFARPRQPFGINMTEFGSKQCSDEVLGDILDDLLLASDIDGPYEEMTDLIVLHQEDYFIISNKSIAPQIHIWMDKETSIFKAMYPVGKLKSGRLTGDISHDSTFWRVNIGGEITKCPGVIDFNLSDPVQISQPLYQYELAVMCPNSRAKSGPFMLEFKIPTSDSYYVSKEFVVQVKDRKGTHHFTFHRPAVVRVPDVRKRKESSKQLVTVKTEQPPHFSILFIVAVIGAIILLLFLMGFGVSMKQGIPERNVHRFRLRHLLLLVVYVTFQVIYALVVTMTVFVLITMAVNGDTAAFLKQYNQQRSVQIALSQLELDEMQSHLYSEMKRQNDFASSKKEDCDAVMNIVSSDFDMLHLKTENESRSSMEKQDLKALITAHSNSVLNKFSADCVTFRKNYEHYGNLVERKLYEEVERTYSSIKNNTWLNMARSIHRSIQTGSELTRSGVTLQPFMKWAHLDSDITHLATGINLPELDCLQIDRSSSRSQQTVNRIPVPGSYQKSQEDSAMHIKNLWFYQNGTNHAEQNHRTQSAEKKSGITSLNSSSYLGFLVAMICIDVIWFLHRMVKTVSMWKLLLIGYPIYVDVRDKKDDSTDSIAKTSEMTQSGCSLVSCRHDCASWWTKVQSTFFIPKMIGTVFVCLLVYLVSVCAHRFINRDTFSYLGYYNDMDNLMRINEAVINTRIHTHAMRINNLEYPVYEAKMNSHVKRHQYLLSMVDAQWSAIRDTHSNTYCKYLRKINVSADCDIVDMNGKSTAEIKVHGCSFTPVAPRFYGRSVSKVSRIAEAQMDAFLTNIRKIISDTSYIILIYLAIIVVKELLCTVVWIFIKRSGFVSLKVIYETDEPPGSTENSTNR